MNKGKVYYMKLQNLVETKIEDESYFKGPFWIVAYSIPDILLGNFSIVADKHLCTYEGELNRTRATRKFETHESVWKELKQQYNNVEYKYYPRGRVEVYKGTAYINIHSILNTPKIIDTIRKEYCIEKLPYKIGLNDVDQGSHYEYELQ